MHRPSSTGDARLTARGSAAAPLVNRPAERTEIKTAPATASTTATPPTHDLIRSPFRR
jgi:hypothetical protein